MNLISSIPNGYGISLFNLAFLLPTCLFPKNGFARNALFSNHYPYAPVCFDTKKGKL
jgi:hypothetical protein